MEKLEQIVLKNLNRREFPALAGLLDFVKEKGQFAYIITLGSGIEYNSGLVPQNISKMNILASIIIKALGLTGDVIVAGGSTFDKKIPGELAGESVVMNDFAEDLLEYPTNAILEMKSRTTKENAEETLNYLDYVGPVGIVSSEYHAERAEIAFQKVFNRSGDRVDAALMSNKIIDEFINILLIYSKDELNELGFAINENLINRLWAAYPELEDILTKFKNVKGFEAGGRYYQKVVQTVYALPLGEFILENWATRRGGEPQYPITEA